MISRFTGLTGFYRQHFTRCCSISSTTNPSRRIEIAQLKPESLVQLNDSRRRLVRNNYWPTMRRKKLRGALLIFPRKTTRTVRRELYIIRWIRVDEILRLKLERLNIHIAEFPLPEHRCVIRKIAG